MTRIVARFTGFGAVCAVLAAMGGLAGCAAPAAQGVEIARFAAADGGTDRVMRGGDGSTSVVFSGTNQPGVPVPALDGMTDPRVAAQLVVAGESVVLIEGAQPDCAVHSVLLAVRPGTVTEVALTGCTQHYAMAPAEGGTAAALRQTGGRPVSLYTYRDGHLSDPVTERVAARPVARPRPRAATPASASVPSSAPGAVPGAVPAFGAPAAPAGGPVNLDTLQ